MDKQLSDESTYLKTQIHAACGALNKVMDIINTPLFNTNSELWDEFKERNAEYLAKLETIHGNVRTMQLVAQARAAGAKRIEGGMEEAAATRRQTSYGDNSAYKFLTHAKGGHLEPNAAQEIVDVFGLKNIHDLLLLTKYKVNKEKKLKHSYKVLLTAILEYMQEQKKGTKTKSTDSLEARLRAI